LLRLASTAADHKTSDALANSDGWMVPSTPTLSQARFPNDSTPSGVKTRTSSRMLRTIPIQPKTMSTE